MVTNGTKVGGDTVNEGDGPELIGKLMNIIKNVLPISDSASNIRLISH